MMGYGYRRLPCSFWQRIRQMDQLAHSIASIDPSGIDDWISSNTSPHHFGRGNLCGAQISKIQNRPECIRLSIARGCRSEQESTIFRINLHCFILTALFLSSLITFSCDGHDVGPRDTNQAPAQIRPSCLFPKPSHHGTGICSPACNRSHPKTIPRYPKKEKSFLNVDISNKPF